MGSLLGFRPPQFSEDVAWLPAWLQPHPYVEHINGGQTPSQQMLEELPFLQQNTVTGGTVNLSSGEDGRYRSCYLFLSGEESSPVSFAPSSCNVANFNLHLSFDGNSENTPHQLLDASQSERFEPNDSLAETKINQFKVENNTTLINLAPTLQHEKSENLSPFLGNNKDQETTHEEISSSLEIIDIDEAVELSIAASEALLIHELIKPRSNTKSLPASSVLEIALRVKQARVEGYEETFDFSTEEDSEIDNLSNLDETMMGDAYEDVGLCVTGPGDSIISRVEDTYASESHERGEKLKCEEIGAREVNSGDISINQQLNDVRNVDVQLKEEVVLEFFGADGERKVVDDSIQTVSVACDGETLLLLSVQTNPDISFITEKLDFGLGGEASFQATVNSSPQATSCENANRDDNLTNIFQDKFQSRWLGGWTWKKEVNASASMEHNKASAPMKHNKAYAPIEHNNAYALMEHSNASAPMEHNNAKSIPTFFVGETSFLSESADIAPDENSFVQKRDNGSHIFSQSSVPFEGLCNKANEDLSLCKNITSSPSPSLWDPLCSFVPCSISLENSYFPLAQKDNLVNMQKSPAPNTEFLHGEGFFSPVINEDGSHRTVRRKVTSLRSYSMLVSSRGPYLDRENTYCDPPIPLKRDMKSRSPIVQSSVTKLTNEVRDYDEAAKNEARVSMNIEKETGFPLVLNHETHWISRDSKTVEEYLEKTDVENPQVPGRKRVRFSLQTEPTRKNCLTTRTGKRSKRGVTKRGDKECKRPIFQNLEFLLTGFSGKKEKEIVGQIRKFGGIILSDIPSPPSSRGKIISKLKAKQLPIILCSNKLQTPKFLFGCAVNACILKANWLTDSISVGSLLPPSKYLILQNHVGEKCMRIGGPIRCDNYIFDNVGIMLHGVPSFCTKMAKIVKHGGGLVFKTLHWLIQSLDDEKIRVGVVVTDDERRVSRHLKHCASESKISVMGATWLVKSLYNGKLAPFNDKNPSSTSPPIRVVNKQVAMDMSEEI